VIGFCLCYDDTRFISIDARCLTNSLLGESEAPAEPRRVSSAGVSLSQSDLNAHVNTTPKGLWKKKLFEKVAKLILVKT